MLDKKDALLMIGNRIRELRKERRISLKQFSDVIDIEYSNVIRLEKGRSNLTIGTLVKIANALNVDLSELIK